MLKSWFDERNHEHYGNILVTKGGYDVIDCQSCGFKHIIPLIKQTVHDTFYIEQFYQKEKMLAEYVWEFIARARCRSDAQLSLRTNYGCAIVPSIFGAPYQVFSDKPPWFKEYLSLDEIVHQDLSNIGEKGLYPQISEFIFLWYLEVTPT